MFIYAAAAAEAKPTIINVQNNETNSATVTSIMIHPSIDTFYRK